MHFAISQNKQFAKQKISETFNFSKIHFPTNRISQVYNFPIMQFKKKMKVPKYPAFQHYQMSIIAWIAIIGNLRNNLLRRSLLRKKCILERMFWNTLQVSYFWIIISIIQQHLACKCVIYVFVSEQRNSICKVCVEYCTASALFTNNGCVCRSRARTADPCLTEPAA